MDAAKASEAARPKVPDEFWRIKIIHPSCYGVRIQNDIFRNMTVS